MRNHNALLEIADKYGIVPIYNTQVQCKTHKGHTNYCFIKIFCVKLGSESGF